MRNFRMAQPKTVDELASLLEETTAKAVIMSGGTDLLDRLKSGVASPDIVVDVQGIESLAGIAKIGDGLRIGPMTRVARLIDDPLIARDYPILKQAALSLASPQLRNMGTIGGNLCQRPRCWYFRDPQVTCLKKGGSDCYAFQGRNKYHAVIGGGPCYIVYPSDLAPALMSLGARITIGSAKGDKTLPLEQFYQPPSVDVEKENVLLKDQFLKDIVIPAAKPGQKGAYVKLKERATWDFAIASAAVTGVLRGKTFSEIVVVMGGIAPVPLRLKKAEDTLRGRPITDALLAQAAGEALKDAKPLAENAYKLDFAAAAIKKAVMSLL